MKVHFVVVGCFITAFLLTDLIQTVRVGPDIPSVAVYRTEDKQSECSTDSHEKVFQRPMGLSLGNCNEGSL